VSGSESVPRSPDYRPTAELRAALRRFERESERATRAAGITPQQHLLLLMIAGAPDGSGRSRVTELAGRLQLAQSTVTELVGRAERAGLVARERSPSDRRVSYLRVTPTGERSLAAVVAQLGPERTRLLEFLRHVTTPDAGPA
jgi:DNA-binding MarR family transcriptional regulator